MGKKNMPKKYLIKTLQRKQYRIEQQTYLNQNQILNYKQERIYKLKPMKNIIRKIIYN